MSIDNVLVSICCLTFNHENYVRKTLDGFLMQKTDFKYEILIHDDASTDNTSKIIKEYEEKYPEIIKPIYQEENQHSKGVKITWTYQIPRAIGKYIAICEGDDYWTDPYKLQKQFDLMEKNKNCSVCCHKVGSINADGSKTEGTFPNKQIPDVLNQEEFVKEVANSYQFQTSSYFIRSEVLKQYVGNIPEFSSKMKVGDVGWLLMCAKEGALCYIDEEMSVYRRNVPGSWSDRQKSEGKKLKQSENYINGLREYDKFTDFKYHDYIDYAIAKCKFSSLYNQNKYKEMLLKENKTFFKALPLKSRIIIVGFALFPFLRNIFKK